MSDTQPAGRTFLAYRRTTMIVTGLVLFAFITSHLVNLMLGLHSVARMDAWRWALTGIWSKPGLSQLLTVSLFLHFAMALVSLYYRNTLRLPAYDMAQMIAGIFIIPLLAPHVFGVMAYKELGLVPTYDLLLRYFWDTSPFDGLRQVCLLVVAWLHGGIGIYTWLRSRDGSERTMRFFYPFVVMVPILAMLGYVEAGRQVIPVEEGGTGYVMENNPNANGPTVDPSRIPEIIANTKRNGRITWQVSLVLVFGALIARWIRVSRWKRGRVKVAYVGRRPAEFEAETGLTLLELARVNDVPHANICRGRGRCGTCRVRVLDGGKALPPPDASEAKVLARWNAGPDERLACQLVPTGGTLKVERMVQADYSDLDYAATKSDHVAKPAVQEGAV